jgi:hypothetical protein
MQTKGVIVYVVCGKMCRVMLGGRRSWISEVVCRFDHASGHDFLVMPGAERMRKALSVELLATRQQYVISEASHTFVPTLVY